MSAGVIILITAAGGAFGAMLRAAEIGPAIGDLFMGAMIADAGAPPFHPVYVGTAIASGSLVGSWMNDSGFWIYTKMGGLTALEALKSWTPLLAILGVVAFATTILLATLMPLR